VRIENTAPSSREIGQQLNVATILETRVQRMGDAVRIVATLVDTETDGTILSVTYDRALTAEDMFAIQSELAISVANALEPTITDEELARLRAVPEADADLARGADGGKVVAPDGPR
jgi:TolB-like protein